MRLEPIIDCAHELFPKAMELYRLSFPLHEQREAFSQKNILSDPDYRFCLIHHADIFAGLLLCWETDSFIYVEHFCIFPELRNRQYGQKTLESLRRLGKTDIMEIDPPTDILSQRRKGFYQRCGFVENPYPHVHPPYRPQAKGHPLIVMSSPAQLTEEGYRRFNQYLESRVMADALL